MDGRRDDGGDAGHCRGIWPGGRALVDEQDGGGPTVAKDFEHLNKILPAALTRRDGKYVWHEGEDAKVSFRAADGGGWPHSNRIRTMLVLAFDSC